MPARLLIAIVVLLFLALAGCTSSAPHATPTTGVRAPTDVVSGGCNVAMVALSHEGLLTDDATRTADITASLTLCASRAEWLDGAAHHTSTGMVGCVACNGETGDQALSTLCAKDDGPACH